MTASVTLPMLVGAPALGAAVAYPIRSTRVRSAVLMIVAVLHVTLVGVVWTQPTLHAAGGWLVVDPLGLVVLTLISALFLAVAHYAVGYLRADAARRPRGGRAFVSCLLAFLAAATLVALSHHLALLWIGMETTTLAVAPLVFDRRDKRSLEAVWKYLVLSSVGIAFALLGTFLLATAQPGAVGRPLVLDDMIAQARLLDPAWLRMAFVFIAIGFGTKMGLAPMHSWKPDTYGEAPSLVAGLMAGALTSCAFLGVARVTSICFAAGLDAFVRPILLTVLFAAPWVNRPSRSAGGRTGSRCWTARTPSRPPPAAGPRFLLPGSTPGATGRCAGPRRATSAVPVRGASP